MLDFLARPLRSVLGVAEHEVVSPLEGTERDLLDAARAIERATESIERHVEVIEGLATSIGPLTDSVNRLEQTLGDLVVLLAPVAKAEHGVETIEHLVHLHRRAEPEGPDPAGS
jgi:hypothetical protein